MNENRKNNRGEIRNVEIFSLVWTNRLVNNGAHKHNLETALLRYCVSNVGHCNSSVEQVSLKFLRKIHSRYRFLEFYSSRRLIINLGDFYAKFYVKYRRVGFSLFRFDDTSRELISRRTAKRRSIFFATVRHLPSRFVLSPFSNLMHYL